MGSRIAPIGRMHAQLGDQVGGPGSGGDDHGAGADHAAVGQAYTRDRRGVAQEGGDPGVLQDAGATALGRLGEVAAGGDRVAVTAPGFEGEGGEVLGLQAGPQGGDAVVG